MKKLALYFIFTFCFFNVNAQKIEKAIDNKDKTISLINAFVQSTYKGNTITDFNYLDINTKQAGKYTLILKILKYKNFKENLAYFISQKTDTVLFNKQSRKFKDNLATSIIKKAIKNRRKHFKQQQFFKATYYSKQQFYIKNAPKKILGIDLGDLGGGLDSTRSGQIYLSETFSTIWKKRNQFKEHIKAVKVNGLENKTGFNNVTNNYYNLYKNTVILGDEIISPIAKLAPFFYKYKLVDSVQNSNKTISYKIKVIPRRKIANVFNGFIYISKKNHQLTKVNLYVKGKQIQQPKIDNIKLKQDFIFHKKQNLWLVSNQESSFKFNQFGIHLYGSIFSHYQDYNFHKNTVKNQFNELLLSFDDDATKKTDLYWIKNRPIPLSKENQKEYYLKEQIFKKRHTKLYLEKQNTKQNHFEWSDLVFDYNHRNLYKHNRFKISFPLNTMYNTVQGVHSTLGFSYFKDRKHQNYNIKTLVNYGFSDKQLRGSSSFNYRFNDKVNSILSIYIGRKLTEFNDPYSTAPLFNTLSTLFFEENNSKYYDKYFSELNYHQELFNGFFLNAKLSYEKRKPVFNHSYFTFFNWKDAVFTSNNPLQPNNFNNTAIKPHNMFKINIKATFKIGQQYLLYPNRKINLETHYPKLSLQYIKGVSSNEQKYNFDYLETRLFQNFKMGNKGVFAYNFKIGKFINKKELSFIDYKHFDITQVHVSLVKDYTNHFALLPAYDFSTQNPFAELHIEHQFKGYVLNKIPIINKLQNKLIIGANTLFTKEHKPYSELYLGLNNIGFGKYRFLRMDYVRTFIGDKSTGSFIFGLSL